MSAENPRDAFRAELAGQLELGLTVEPRPRGVLYRDYSVSRLVDELRRIGYTIHEPGEGCPIPLRPGARRGDPSTSGQAAREVDLPRARALAVRILREYGRAADRLLVGLTPDEAARDAAYRLTRQPGRSDRRRVSDLLALGFLEPVPAADGTPVTRRDPESGRAQRVLRITASGRDYLGHLDRAAS